MGAFRSKPIVDKDSSDGGNAELKWGACCMQGWRLTQEDAHNCILDYDGNTSFFAVYDGHGGHEVSQYCSERLPDFIKNTEAYKAGDIEKALVDGYLGFDGTLVQEDVVQQLKRIAQDKEPGESEDENEDISELFEEATMPIEQVIEKYRTGTEEKRGEKRKNTSTSECSSSSSAASSSSSCSKSEAAAAVAAFDSPGSSSSSKADQGPSNNEADNKKKDDAGQSSEVSESSSENGVADSTENKPKEPPKATEKTNEGDLADSSTCVSGAVSTSDEKDVQENGDISKKGKGKALAKTKGIMPSFESIRNSIRKTTNDLYKQLLSAECDDEENDSTTEDEDTSFESPDDASSDEDSEDVNNVTVNEENSEEEEEQDPDEEEEEEEDDDDDDEEGEHSEMGPFRGDFMKHSPGLDSGCTAVVAVLKGNDLYVANAGDSRCVVCRKGEAIPMSFDHKPYQDIECERIKKAGGRIDSDKRVNGGLNLSRAIGDHAYKQNETLSDREQMITALPDIKKLTINPAEDEFMVLACDGIWDCYSNQEVVDFVRERLQEGRENLSQICEEMFDSCLSKYKYSDLGSDNMTAIIVRFNNSASANSLKRPLSPSSDGVAEKRAKTDQSESNVDTTV